MQTELVQSTVCVYAVLPCTTLAVLQLLSLSALRASITDLSAYLHVLHCPGVKLTRYPSPHFKTTAGPEYLFISGFVYTGTTAILLQKPYNRSQAPAWSHAEALDLFAIWREASEQEALVASHWNKDVLTDIAAQRDLVIRLLALGWRA